MTTWSLYQAHARVHHAVAACGLSFSERRYKTDKSARNGQFIFESYTDGVVVSQYKNTWKRKRETGYLVHVAYNFNGFIIMNHVEPWVKFPSDELVAKLTLLPRKVDQK